MLEEKIDLLTKEVVSLRKAVEANTAGGGATASGKPAADEEEAAPKRSRGRPKKDEAAAPKHSAEEVEDKIRQVSREVGKPIAKKIIAGFKCDDLADLLTHPEHFDAAVAKADEALAVEEEEEEEEDDI